MFEEAHEAVLVVGIHVVDNAGFYGGGVLRGGLGCGRFGGGHDCGRVV